MVGGQEGDRYWNALNYAEIYDTSTKTWSEGPNLPDEIIGHCFINLVGDYDRVMMVWGKYYLGGITHWVYNEQVYILTMKDGRNW